jgi:diacylglycerol kinase (ATP)
MSEVKKLLFIVNKRAGTGFHSQVEGRIMDACKKFDRPCSIVYTEGPGHATRLAQEGIEKKFTGIVAVGGDGTVNEVARALVHTNTSMGIIPKGSGNGLGRHLGISMKIDEALNQLLTGSVVTIDTFLFNEQLSLNVSGIGFDGHVANLFDSKKVRGFWGYSKIIVKEYFKFNEFTIQIHTGINSPVTHHAFILAIANSSQYGNNARIAPSASVIDHLLQVTLIRKIPVQRVLAFAYAMFTGKLKPGKDYLTLPMQQATITTGTPVPFHVDGEPCGISNRFSLKVLPKSLSVIVPDHRLIKM